MSLFKIIPILIFITLSNLILAQNTNEIEKTELEILYHQKIPMQDGVKLAATIVKPVQVPEEGLPTLFMLTPYIADRNHDRSIGYAKEGYILLTADVRGRGNSEGIAIPFDTVDGKDGADICKWIIKQPWSDGQIAMYGGSYRGMVQWQTLKEMPPGLKTIVPTASVGPGFDFPKRNNIFYTFLGPYLTYISGKTGNLSSFTDIEFWKRQYIKLFKGEISYSKLIELAGIENHDFNKWLKHPSYDDFWKNMMPVPDEYKNFNIPILTITGYYDDDQTAAMNYYHNYMKYAQPNGKDNHYLVIGPWDHGGTRKPQSELGELKFAENCVIDMHKLHIQWFNWILKNGDKPDFLKDKINYYVMGENVWNYQDAFENLNNSELQLFLSSKDGNATDIFQSGILQTVQPKNQQPDKYNYDPLDDSFLDYDLEDGHLINYSLYKSREAHKGAGLIYISSPMEKEYTIAGRIKLTAYLSMDVKDADLEILLYEITPDGKILFLTTDYLRARYRNSLEMEELLIPNEIYKYEFNTPYLIVRKLSKNSRICLIIRNLNSPHYQKNFQSGGNISEEVKNVAEKSNVTLYHDSKYPSFLLIPIQ